MADAPNTAQQSFDAQQMDNQALQQPGAGDAAAPTARADVTVTTPNVGNQDGPSIVNNTSNLNNNQGNQGAPNSGNVRTGDAANSADGNNLGGADGGVARVAGEGGVNPFTAPANPVASAAPLPEATVAEPVSANQTPVPISPNTFNNITVPLVADAVVDTIVENNAPIISSLGDQDIGIVKEDTKVTTSGQFTSIDVDSTTAIWSIESPSDDFGSMEVDQNGKWTYTLNNSEKVQALAAEESFEKIYTIVVTDDKGAFDIQEVTITIQGTNDAPVIFAEVDQDIGSIQEDIKLSTSGQLTSGDVDNAATAKWAIDGSDSSDYGSISVDQTGKWTYTLNDSEKVQTLAANESFKEIYTIAVTDGTTTAFQAVTITIAGNNDMPVVSVFSVGQDAGVVREDRPVNGVYVTKGQFTLKDIDANLREGPIWSIDGSAISDYGSIAVDQTGQWIYTLNNESSDLQALSDGESIRDMFTIAVTDESGAVATKDVTITIFGTNSEIVGSAGIDILSSGAEEEIIRGYGDADILTGGAGADIFQYDSPTDLTTTPGSIERITDFSSVDGDKIDFTSLLSSADSLTNTIKIDPTDGSSANLVSILIGGATYLLDVNNANPVAGSPGTFYELDSQALLGNLGTQASWTDVVDLRSATGFQGEDSQSITGDGWTLKVLDSSVTYLATNVPGGTSTMEFFRGVDTATDVNVQITTFDGVVHDVSNADKITWHG